MYDKIQKEVEHSELNENSNTFDSKTDNNYCLGNEKNRFRKTGRIEPELIKTNENLF